MGLSPAQATNDDKPDAKSAAQNRFAQVVEADADQIYTKLHTDFLPADVTQKVETEADGTVPKWGAGAADVEFFPINDGTSGDGLIVRVTLMNNSQAAQTYFVDLLGGIDVPNASFLSKDLQVSAQDETVFLKHARRETVFALSAQATTFPLRAYRVSDAYWKPQTTLPETDAQRVVLPPGRLSLTAAKSPKSNTKASEQSAEVSVNAMGETQWGLLRYDDITVAPQQSLTLTFCVALAGNNETAANLADTLLGLTDDIVVANKPREGAVSLAQKLHAKLRPQTGNAALDRLLMQSAVNVPFIALRRIGIDSRDALVPVKMTDVEAVTPAQYDPLVGAFLALGWVGYRPDWSAAELNAHFLTRLNAEEPVPIPQALPPFNLFVLWELYQRTHDRALLTQFYAHARRRYNELLAAGKGKDKSTENLFAYPILMKKLADAPKPAISCEQTELFFAPDYSAYVVRAAKIMKQMAEATRQKPEEIERYDKDARAAAEAMIATLWDANARAFVDKTANGKTGNASQTAASLLPLLTSELSLEQQTALFERLKDSAQFWSGFGVRSRSKSAPDYKPERDGMGAVGFAVNWLLWKSLLDAGETQTAQTLAENLVAKFGASPGESLHGETGAGIGDGSTTGDTMALVALHAAYHRMGTVTAGWDCNLMATEYDVESDRLRLVYKTGDKNSKGVIVIVMGKPDTTYRLEGGAGGTVKSDKNGVVVLPVGNDPTTQQITLKRE